MKNIKNYEPKFEFKLTDNMNIDFNSSFIEVLTGMGIKNAVDCIRILKNRYGISYRHLANVMGVAPSTVKTALAFETFQGVLKDDKLIESILRLQMEYLHDVFCEVVDLEEEEPREEEEIEPIENEAYI